MQKKLSLGFLRFFWVQQMLTLVLLGGIVYIQIGDATVNPEAIRQYGVFLSVFAVLLLAGGLVFRRIKLGVHALPLVMNRTDSTWSEGLTEQQKEAIKDEALLLYKTATIMGTATAEAAAICGIALAFMSKMTVLYLPFAGAAGAVILWQLPNQTSLDAICGALVQQKKSSADS